MSKPVESYLTLAEGKKKPSKIYYFRLRGNWLIYFNDGEDSEAVGEISLEKYSDAPIERRRDFAFQLNQPNTPSGVGITLKAKTEEDYDMWLTALKSQQHRRIIAEPAANTDPERKGFLVAHLPNVEPREFWCKLTCNVFMIFSYLHDETPLGSLPLSQFVLYKDPVGSVTYCFWLEHPEKKNVFKFEASSEEERQEWVKSIEEALENLENTDGNLAEYMEVHEHSKKTKSKCWIVQKGSYLMIYSNQNAFQPDNTLNLSDFYFHGRDSDHLTITNIASGAKFSFYPEDVLRSIQQIGSMIGIKDPSVKRKKTISSPHGSFNKKTAKKSPEQEKKPDFRLLSTKSFFISHNALQQGYLFLNKPKVPDWKFKEVFCVVSGNSLSWANSIIDTKPSGNIMLSDYVIEEVSSDEKHPNSFLCKKSDTGDVDYIFSALDTGDLNVWLEALKKARTEPETAPEPAKRDIEAQKEVKTAKEDLTLKPTVDNKIADDGEGEESSGADTEPVSTPEPDFEVKGKGAEKGGALSGGANRDSIVEALHTFKGTHSSHLTFRKGDLLKVGKRINSEWYYGTHGGVSGYFPSSYVKIISSQPAQKMRSNRPETPPFPEAQNPAVAIALDPARNGGGLPKSRSDGIDKFKEQQRERKLSEPFSGVGEQRDKNVMSFSYRSTTQSKNPTPINIPRKMIETFAEEEDNLFANPLKQGEMYLQFGRSKINFHTARKKWVILKDEAMYYFKQAGDIDLLGTLPLDMYFLKLDAKLKKKSQFVLEHLHRKEEDAYVSISDPDEYIDWCDILTSTLQKSQRNFEARTSSTGMKTLEKEKRKLENELEELRLQMGAMNTKYFNLATNSQEKYQEYVAELHKEKKIRSELSVKAKKFEVELLTLKATEEATVKYDWEKTRDIQLTIRKGETLIILEKLDSGWWRGVNQEGLDGWFPSSFAEARDRLVPAETQTDLPTQELKSNAVIVHGQEEGEAADAGNEDERTGLRERIKELESAIHAEEGRRMQIGNIVLNYVKPEVEKARLEVAEEKQKNERLSDTILKMDKIINTLQKDKLDTIRTVDLLRNEKTTLESDKDRLVAILRRQSVRNASTANPATPPARTTEPAKFVAIISRNASQEGHLSFKQSDEIEILHVDEATGLWKGKKADGSVGWVPSEYVDQAPQTVATKGQEKSSKSEMRLAHLETSKRLARGSSSSPPIRAFMSSSALQRRRRVSKDPYQLSLKQKLDMFESAARSFRA